MLQVVLKGSLGPGSEHLRFPISSYRLAHSPVVSGLEGSNELNTPKCMCDVYNEGPTPWAQGERWGMD